jgi:hypothetical protein
MAATSSKRRHHARRRTLGIGQETKVPDLDEAPGQDVLHETPQEFHGVERHRLVPCCGRVVLVAEGHAVVL